MSNSFRSSNLTSLTTYYNVSVLTSWRKCIVLHPLFILADYNLMWRGDNV